MVSHNGAMFGESSVKAWQLRYGSEAPDGMPDLGRFLNHRSIREYSGEAVPEPVVAGLVAAAQSAATSSNLQTWSMVSVQDPQAREKLAVLVGNQQQVRDAAWFFAFTADLHRLEEAAHRVGEAADAMDYTELMLVAIIDAALAAERMVCAAESIGLGICYIGSLRNDPDEVKEILGLPERTAGLFGLCLGWPKEGSTAAIKPRLAQESVWFREKYGETTVEDYDSRMSAFYEEQGMKGAVTWSMRSGRRVSEAYVEKRKMWKGFLERQGLGRR